MIEIIAFMLLLAAVLGAFIYFRQTAEDSAQSADEDGVVRVRLSDRIGLQESMGTGSAPHLKHTPKPGTAVVAVLNGERQPLAVDTLDVSRTAPAGAQAPWTNVIAQPGPEKQHYKYGLFAVGDEPFDLPSHLKRSDASYYGIWWSMENAHE